MTEASKVQYSMCYRVQFCQNVLLKRSSKKSSYVLICILEYLLSCIKLLAMPSWQCKDVTTVKVSRSLSSCLYLPVVDCSNHPLELVNLCMHSSYGTLFFWWYCISYLLVSTWWHNLVIIHIWYFQKSTKFLCGMYAYTVYVVLKLVKFWSISKLVVRYILVLMMVHRFFWWVALETGAMP
jgi:hypothetical protein